MWRHCFTETRLEYSENIAKDVLGRDPLLLICASAAPRTFFPRTSPQQTARCLCNFSKEGLEMLGLNMHTFACSVCPFLFLNLFGVGPRCCFEAWRIAHAQNRPTKHGCQRVGTGTGEGRGGGRGGRSLVSGLLP